MGVARQLYLKEFFDIGLVPGGPAIGSLVI
jgi:hypothetical protein